MAMSTIKCRLCCKRWVTFTTVGFVLNMMSLVSSIVTIVYFSVQMGSLHHYDYIYAYKKTTCTPIRGYSLNLTCNGNSDIKDNVKWIAAFTLSNGLRMVENPFAVRDSRITAIRDRDRLELNTTNDCMCIPFNDMGDRNKVVTMDCTIWTRCILDVEFIKYIQHDNRRYYHTYISFIITSVVSVALSIAALPISIRAIRHISQQQDYIEL